MPAAPIVRKNRLDRTVEQPEAQIGFAHSIVSATNPLMFQIAGRLPNAGGVGHLDGPAVDGETDGDGVARGARNRRDDAALVARQRVHQAALADVRSAGNDDLPCFDPVSPQRDQLVESLQLLHDPSAVGSVLGIEDFPQTGLAGPIRLIEQDAGGARRRSVREQIVELDWPVEELLPPDDGSAALLVEFLEHAHPFSSALAMQFHAYTLR